MLFTKIFHCSLDIENPISIMRNADNAVMNILRNTYEKKCYKNSYILKILEIVERSPCTVCQDGDPKLATMKVSFKAQAIYYNTNEIIADCKMINKNQIMMAKNDIVYAMISMSRQFESIVQDQYLPIRVAKSKYKLGSPAITVSAVPLTPFDKTHNVIYTYNGNDISNIDEINSVIAIAQEEQKLSEKYKNNELYNKIVDLLYPYKSYKKIDEKNLVSLLDIKKLPKGNGYIGRNIASKITSDLVLFSTSEEYFEYTIIINNATPANAIINLLYDYISRMQMLRIYTDLFDNKPDLLEKNNNVFKIWESMKYD